VRGINEVDAQMGGVIEMMKMDVWTYGRMDDDAVVEIPEGM
jgi:hypothetical protein